MVEGEQRPERLQKATNLYNDLKRRHPEVGHRLRGKSGP